MRGEIINKIERNLRGFIGQVDKTYALKRISPFLSARIKEFVLRRGKRIRPLLFVIGYLGFAKRPSPGLYRCAISFELLHDFMLIHDDIIDKSATRRGKPSMHAMLNRHLKGFRNLKFNGQDLSIVVGDVIYAMAIDAFLAIRENMERKEKALKKFIEAAVYTGSGEFIELLCGTKELRDIKKSDIYKIYDFKTAYYSFAIPLAAGAILGGANDRQIDKLTGYGICLGRAFQIKDDIVGMFSEESEIGKSTLTDLREAKKTLLLWRAFNNSCPSDKSAIKQIFSRENITMADLRRIRKIAVASGALEYAKKEIAAFQKKAEEIFSSCRMRPPYKKILSDYAQKILGF